MQIHSPCVIALTWSLSDANGEVLDTLADPVEFLFGGDDLLPRVEEALDGQEVGFETMVHLEPVHAFGDYDSHLVCFEARALFPDNVDDSMQFDGLPDGCATPDMPRDRIYRVTEVYPDHVVLDGNHPLAGMALRIQLRVHDVRAATMAEIDARSVTPSELSVFSVAPTAPGLH